MADYVAHLFQSIDKLQVEPGQNHRLLWVLFRLTPTPTSDAKPRKEYGDYCYDERCTIHNVINLQCKKKKKKKWRRRSGKRSFHAFLYLNIFNDT